VNQLHNAYVGLTLPANNKDNTRTVPMRLSPILLSTVFVLLNLGGVALAQPDPPPAVGSGADRDTFDPASGRHPR
jgi:hypothetical protein